MKFETLTYSAACFERGASAPKILGRSSCSSAALSPDLNLAEHNLSGPIPSGSLSAAMLRFWVWMQMQLSVLRDRAVRGVCSTPSHIVHIPTSEPDAPRKAVRVNRAMMRRLRRLVRLQGERYFDGPSVADECERLGLTLRQYQDYLIRCKGYSRVQIYGLGWGRHRRFMRALICAALQGDAASFMRKAICAAPLSPD